MGGDGNEVTVTLPITIMLRQMACGQRTEDTERITEDTEGPGVRGSNFRNNGNAIA